MLRMNTVTEVSRKGFMSWIQKECWNDLNNTEYKYTDNIEKQQIPKNIRDGAVEEEEL